MTLQDLNKDYATLMENYKDQTLLATTTGIIYWDMETKMPPKGIQLRSQQLALLQKIAHRMQTDPENGKLIQQITSHPQHHALTPTQRRNIHLTKKEYDEATKLPEKLVVETARQQAITIDTWKKAKAAQDFQAFKPDLEKLYNLIVQAADILQSVKGTPTPYDALIDVFEPGVNATTISQLFDEMKAGLMKIIEKCTDSPNQPDTRFLNVPVPVDTQRKIAQNLVASIGYDTTTKEARGRIDETEHPFTVGYYDDIRITTHYHENKFTSSIFSVLHEGGHAIYDQNLPADWIYQPIGSSSSYGIHESQSRYIENIIGRSPEFWVHLLPRLKAVMENTLNGVSHEQFVHAINQVKPSKIRIEADEVTYGLHIIIRFEIERDLFAGKLTIDELPQTWNEKYSEYLGVDVENDSEGVMQDTHWAGGSYGYFPSYALGNLYGGMMFEKMQKVLPQYREEIKAGNVSLITAWLAENVHSKGDLHDPLDLIEKVTGGSLNVRPFLRYLNEKYSKIYSY
jgi:carboxypeptidase Taq